MANCINSEDDFGMEIPSDLDYIPPIRQFVSELVEAKGFTKKFCFRTEVVVDELCTNAIVHGSQEINDHISVSVKFGEEQVKMVIQNKGGTEDNINSLKAAIEDPGSFFSREKGRGIAMAKLLCDELKMEPSGEGFTQVVVIKSTRYDSNEPGENQN